MTVDRAPLRLLVCGGRDFADEQVFDAAIRPFVLSHDLTIICGYDPDDERFQGADQLAYRFARRHGLPVFAVAAKWHKFGRSAGPRRNSRMMEAMPEQGLAFPRANGEWGEGTVGMVCRLCDAKIKVTEVGK